MTAKRLEQIRAMPHGPVVDELIAEIQECWKRQERLRELVSAASKDLEPLLAC